MFYFFFFSSLLIFSLEGIFGQETNRTYLIKKDFISGLKGGEFTIYDNVGKTQLFRMETKVGVTHNVNLYRGKEKTKPLALLKGKFTAVLYKANLAVLNEKTNSFNNGSIQQNYKIVGNKFIINYQNTNISMEGKAASLDTTFIDQSNQNVLAKFRKRVSSLFWRNKYDLQVLSNQFPDQIYFLGVAARDHTNKKILSG